MGSNIHWLIQEFEDGLDCNKAVIADVAERYCKINNEKVVCIT
jgi:hypothetical protein